MGRDRIKFLIVAAYAKELAPFCRLGSKHFIIKKNVAFLAAGIGPVAAAFGLTHFLEDYRPERIIGIGTAGIIHKKLKIGDLVVGQLVAAELGGPKKKSSLCPPCSLRPFCPDLSQVNIFSPQEISKTEVRCKQLHAAGHDVENLEAYALAFVAQKFKIPFVSLLGLTNHVGPKGHAEWLKNEAFVCEKLAQEVKKLLS